MQMRGCADDEGSADMQVRGCTDEGERADMPMREFMGDKVYEETPSNNTFLPTSCREKPG
jgi:hypothetical protein